MNNVRPPVIFYGCFKCMENTRMGTLFFDLFKELRKIRF
jgi:hypothetical protein